MDESQTSPGKPQPCTCMTDTSSDLPPERGQSKRPERAACAKSLARVAGWSIGRTDRLTCAWTANGRVQMEGGLTTQLDEAGRLAFPAEIAARFGLAPAAPVEIEEEAGSLRLRRPVTHLAKLYIEPTVRCNLACRTCIRNVWNEPGGDMTGATFAAVIAGLRNFKPPPTVFFGGFGEPLGHPGIIDMVADAKALGCPVELITNGVLLTEQTSRQLIGAGLDRLWVSLDGARLESYADVRLGATLPTVLANLGRFSDSRPPLRPRQPEIGIAFVAMRRNIADLPRVLSLGRELGASRFLVTGVLPYTTEMQSEILYPSLAE